MGSKTIKVTSLDEADLTLSKIAELSRDIVRLETKRDKKIADAKLEVKEDLLILRERIAAHEQAVEEFSENNKEDFKKHRSRKLSFGVIGFRKSTKLVCLSKWNWRKVLVALLKRKSRAGLRIEFIVNKRILNTWSDEKLKAIGVKKKAEDKFFMELSA